MAGCGEGSFFLSGWISVLVARLNKLDFTCSMFVALVVLTF